MSEWQGETNPGNYQGPEINDLGLIINNSDEVTHVPETPAERKERKKKKDDLEAEVEAGTKEKNIKEDQQEPVISLEALLNDPQFIQQLMAELNKYHVDSQIETVVKNITHLLLEV
jgi:hypothetical protein